MLSAPWSWSSSIIWATRATETSAPKLPELIWAFWQKTQRSVQAEKKMAPEPASPEMGGSSQKCRAERATRRLDVAPQAPRAPAARFAPHERGQRWQEAYSRGICSMGPPNGPAATARLDTKRADHIVARSAIPGGDEGNRTLGLCHATAALSQLSYVPRRVCARAIVP